MATIKHVFTSPKADGTDTSLVRPSDWNSSHLFTFQEAVSLSGNTAGVLANISSGTFYLAGGNNITVSQNANSVTISGGDTSQFLTTAMASNRGSDFVQATATIAGTNISGTIASNVISLSVGAGGGDTTGGLTDFLYQDRGELEAQPWEYVFAGANITINESPGGDAITLVGPSPSGGTINISAGTTSNDLTNIVLSNSNGVSFGLNGSTITATVQTNYLTTARASTDAIGLNTAGTNITWTANSSGLSINAGGYAGTGFTSTTTAGTEIEATNNTAGLSMAVPAFLTTALASNASTAFVQANATIVGTDISGTIASNVISLSIDAGSQLWLDFMYDAIPADFIYAGDNLFLSESPTGDAVTLDAWSYDIAGHDTPIGELIFGSNLTVTDASDGFGLTISAPATSLLSAGSGISISTNGSTIIIMTV